jgi:prepilin-type N-terminal cleavage/methylation domain-containing protein
MTLLELLVVVGIIGILSAAAIWNYFVAINRAKQKKTMADMRSIALSWEMYALESNTYIPAASVLTFPGDTIPLEDMKNALAPAHMQSFPEKDGWDNPFDFAVDTDGEEKGSYFIRSRGADGLVDESYDAAFTSSFDNDIIISNGIFVISPKAN